MISGLGCNIEKSSIMFLGPTLPEIEEQISGLGFQIVDNLTILGFQIDARCQNLVNNFDRIITKVTRIANEWRNFGLSLIGRIAISKTFLISQVNYIGSILTPTDNQLLQLQGVIDGFVLGGMPYAKDRLYVKPDKGGLGLLNIRQMITAAHCLWLSRIELGGLIDSWRVSILRDCGFDFKKFRPSVQNNVSRPIEHMLTSSWWNFFTSFWGVEKNYLEAPLFFNPFFPRGMSDTGRFDTGPVDGTVIGAANMVIHKDRLLSFSCKNTLNGAAVKNYAEMIASIGIQITVNQYMSLRKSINHAISTKGTREGLGTQMCIVTFIRRGKKGAKRFRRILEYNTLTCIKGLNVTDTYCNLVGINRVPDVTGGKMLGCWNTSFLPIDLRVFSFQFFNNSLPLGARLVNRYRNVNHNNISDCCTFCQIRNYGVPERETFKHLFFSCPALEDACTRFADKYFSNDLSHVEKMQCFFTGSTDEIPHKVDLIVCVLFAHEIWQSKLLKKIPNFTTVEFNMRCKFDILIDISKKFKESVVNSDSLWCRHWRIVNGYLGQPRRG